MGKKTTYILQITLAIAGIPFLFTKLFTVGILMLICSYFVWKKQLKPLKTDWLDVYNSQNRRGRRKMLRDLKKIAKK